MKSLSVKREISGQRQLHFGESLGKILREAKKQLENFEPLDGGRKY